MKLPLFLISIIFLSLICISSVSALAVTINATKTTYVRQDSADTNFGTSLNLEIRNGVTNVRRTYLYFPVELAPNNSITDASLCLYQITDGTTLNGFIYYLYSDWKNISNSNQILNETELTWNNQPCGVNFDNATNCNLTQINGQATDSTGAYECWNVTNIATREYYNNNISFVIKTAENSALTNDVFASSRNKSYIPYLQLNFIDTTLPNINFTNPTTSGTYDRHFILINVSATDDVAIKNITIKFYNSTGIYNVTTTLTSPNFVNISGLPYGSYYFNATARDTSNNRNDTETRNINLTCLPNWVQYNSTCNLQNTTYYLYNDTKFCNSTLNLPVNNGTSNSCLYLSVNIVSPPNNTITNVTGQNLTINVTGDASIQNITWIISNETAIINTTTISGQKGVIGEMFSFLYDSVFNWFVRVTDTAGNIFTTAINYILVDTTQPFLNIVYPLNSGNYNVSIFDFSYTISDNLAGLDKCWFVNSTTTLFITCGSNLSLTALEGSNTWYIYANDTAGNINTRNVTFFVDTIIPLIAFINNTLPDNSYVSQNYIFVNVSASDSNFQNITYSLRTSNGSLYLITFNSLITSSIWTNLADDTYNYSVFIRDVANNRNTTGIRTITLDTTAPNITINSPENINYSTSLLFVNITSEGNFTWFYNGTGLELYTSPIYRLYPDGVNNITAYTNDTLNNIGTHSVYPLIHTIAPNMSYVLPTELNGSIVGRNYIQVNVSAVDFYLQNITINFYNSALNLIGSSTGNSTPFYSELVNISDGRYFFNANSCDSFDNCATLPVREVNVNKTLNNELKITLGVPSYPYVAVNITYPLQARVFIANSNVLDANTTIIIHSPDGTNATFEMVLNPINYLYETSLLFNDIGDYPFTINANSFVYGHKDISGTFLVRQSYNVTFCGYMQSNGNPYVNDFAYLIAEPTTSKVHYDDTLEQFLTPLLFSTSYKTPVFYTLYRNGCGTLILFDKEQYALRLFDGQATFTETLSAPNISKTYGTNTYLGRYDLNGTTQTYKLLLSEKDLHQYTWLANIIFIVVCVLALILSLVLVFLVPQYPAIPFYIGIGFISMACLIRIVIWVIYGW